MAKVPGKVKALRKQIQDECQSLARHRLMSLGLDGILTLDLRLTLKAKQDAHPITAASSKPAIELIPQMLRERYAGKNYIVNSAIEAFERRMFRIGERMSARELSAKVKIKDLFPGVRPKFKELKFIQQALHDLGLPPLID